MDPCSTDFTIHDNLKQLLPSLFKKKTYKYADQSKIVLGILFYHAIGRTNYD